MTRNKLLDIDLPEVGEEEIDAHFHLLPDSYFVTTPNTEIALHVRMINRLLYEINHADSIGSLKPIIQWSPDVEAGVSAVNVVTWDRAGLFHKLAGALNIAGYNIIGATAMSRTDNIAIDTFYVEERGGRHVSHSESVFQETLGKALVSNSDLYPIIKDKFLSQYRKHPSTRDNPIAHSFHSKMEIYLALSLKNAILEYQAPDTPGLLYQIAHELHRHGFDITTANVTTKQGIAIDTLNFRSIVPNRVIERESLQALLTHLRNILQSLNPYANQTS